MSGGERSSSGLRAVGAHHVLSLCMVGGTILMSLVGCGTAAPAKRMTVAPSPASYDVSGALAAVTVEVQHCTERFGRPAPMMGVRFEIAPDGQAHLLSVDAAVSSTMRDCLRDAFAAARFGRFEGQPKNLQWTFDERAEWEKSHPDGGPIVGLDRGDVVMGLHAVGASVNECARSDQSEVRIVRLTIGSDGIPRHVGVQGKPHPGVDECVVRAVAGARFRPFIGDWVTIDYPFMLRSGH